MIAAYGPEGDGIPVVQVHSSIEMEYAAIRKGAAILDRPQRAVIEVTGDDRIAFLNRMLTQELKDLAPFQVRRSFWLSRKGRIDADLCVIERGDRVLIDLDSHALKRTLDGLGAFVIADDVVLADRGDTTHRLSLHGPGAAALLARVSTPVAGPAVAELKPGQACTLAIGGAACTVWRDDTAGEVGLELVMPVESAAAVYGALAQPPTRDPAAPDRAFTQSRDGRAVRAGWHAYNIARIEAGTPLYYLDFGPDSLPHETGEETLHDRVSFKKGCYLGQEIVARMQSLGHPKQRLVGLDFPDASPGEPDARPPQPVTGSRITQGADPAAEAVGAVTSSALSPMLGSRPVCFAMVKHRHTAPGATLCVHAEAVGPMKSVVRKSIAFWKRPGSPVAG